MATKSTLKEEEILKFREYMLDNNMTVLTSVQFQEGDNLKLNYFICTINPRKLYLPDGWKVNKSSNNEYSFYNKILGISIPIHSRFRERLW